ncbi:hypothetical protein Ddc_24385 [Ditylenchus destructor]|nr:hypothetical protein Ddc_24385 [Ditylenchus destructor]
MGGAFEPLGELRAAQHPDKSPYPVVVDRRALSGSPDKTDDAEALARVGMQQELLIALGIGLGELIGGQSSWLTSCASNLPPRCSRSPSRGLPSINSARAPMKALSLSGCGAPGS